MQRQEKLLVMLYTFSSRHSHGDRPGISLSCHDCGYLVGWCLVYQPLEEREPYQPLEEREPWWPKTSNSTTPQIIVEIEDCKTRRPNTALWAQISFRHCIPPTIILYCRHWSMGKPKPRCNTKNQGCRCWHKSRWKWESQATSFVLAKVCSARPWWCICAAIKFAGSAQGWNCR